MTDSFIEVKNLIQQAQSNTLKAVNKELICLYWEIGKYISSKIKLANWGESVVAQLSIFILQEYPALKGFTRRGLYRMKQFYETYYEQQKVSALLTQISWTNHLLVLSKTKSIEEKKFYIQLSIKENYSSRELARQIDTGYFERHLLAINKQPQDTIITASLPSSFSIFKDPYILEFLNLPAIYSERDLQKAIRANLKQFILEIGKDFSFLGEEYRVHVSGKDYYIDLLFYHRGLKCLVPLELKIDSFKPEYLSKLNFYLELLDKNLKKPEENPSVGLLLCKSKDDEIVEYAMNRTLSSTKVAEYQTKLIDKKILKQKLHFYDWESPNKQAK
ncbi:DUF1016 domain-containing protein [bacterium]|nr:DUF1016 domain-containing protein [bacterium]MBT4552039.1 DUF1016 domain-containing protein [bacterium]MBT5988814.1 DUF1016 domain-containing protein [bacterium]MBT7088183.1 DUF1016 domain-containing protein [bacterium]